MNCKESLQKVYEFLDGELKGVSCAEIEKHLEQCRCCWDRFEFEKKLKAMVKSSCCKESCSEKLKSRIKALLDKY